MPNYFFGVHLIDWFALAFVWAFVWAFGASNPKRTRKLKPHAFGRLLLAYWRWQHKRGKLVRWER